MRILQSVKPAPVLTVLLIVLLLNAGCGGKAQHLGGKARSADTGRRGPADASRGAAAHPTRD